MNTKTTNTTEFEGGTYRVHVQRVSSDVVELSVLHRDWADIQWEVRGSAHHLLVTPTIVGVITSEGLVPARYEEDLWGCIPMVNPDPDDCNPRGPYYADYHAAEAVVDYLRRYLREVCPNWDNPIPGRRHSK